MDEKEKDNLMEEMMLDVWDGLKEEPDSRKKGYPAKKRKSEKKINAEGKKKKQYLIHYRFDGLDVSEIQRAYSAEQAVTVFCKTADAWYIKAEIARKTRGFWVEEIKEEKEMGNKEKKMDLDQLVDAANKAAEAEVVNAAEAQQEENNNEKEEVVMSKENEKVQEQVIEEQVEVHEQQEPIVIENVVPTAEITLETIAKNTKVVNAMIIPENDKKGIIQAVRTDGEIEAIGSYVLGGGYAFPLFRIESKWFKKTTFGVKRTVDTTARTIKFSGSKNYMALLKLLFSDEEIEAAKAAEISRRFPPICQRSESKGFPKNIFVDITLPDGSQLKIDGWKQREHRPLYLENSDRTVTVRWDFGKGYQDPSIKFLGKTLRKNHDGISGNAEDAKVFKAIKEAIENALKG